MQGDDSTSRQRPAKRPRIAPPVGFAKSSNPVKITAPKFVSAFDDHRKSVWSPRGSTKPLSKSIQIAPSALPSSTQSKVLGESAPAPLTNRPLRPLKPPSLVLLPDLKYDRQASGSNKSSSKTSLLQPVALSGSNKDKPREALKGITARLVRPPSPPASKVPLKSAVAPPSYSSIPGSSRVPAHKLKSIFETNVARATDINSEHGAAELLGLYLQQHGHGHVDPLEREIQRGLGQSPEKKAKTTKNERYFRGGFAEQAKIRFSQGQTALALWQASLELEMRPASGRRPPSDMRLRVSTVLYTSSHADCQRPAHAPCLALVRGLAKTKGGGGEAMVTALLNFDGTVRPGVRFNDLTEVQAERDICLFRPWVEIDVAQGHANELPLLVGPLRDLLDVHVKDFGERGRVLFCTRFWIVPRTK
ncbi:hypothetical protein WOLCODRAFT_153089 [Wolfiporia cocos MD-104 SS10]|uniref:Uncharacterized protein n=1 Tax=Wolfiporia cocos (strain MD-104) TaxID=742152 RepID=A0A2H3K3P1_WOLCO|nr:hypothetical protein WOLCODRAFT_153089 [Wolfiporia cocos MD-104 SS10]